jgi:hypothetical protein
MLANNNVSAGRVVTKMQFDINSPVPRLLFSPEAAVPPEMRDVVARQSKSPAAESAIKLTVYKVDNPEDGPEQVSEPVVRETVRRTAEKVDDVTDIVKKWTRK